MNLDPNLLPEDGYDRINSLSVGNIQLEKIVATFEQKLEKQETIKDIASTVARSVHQKKKKNDFPSMNAKGTEKLEREPNK